MKTVLVIFMIITCMGLAGFGQDIHVFYEEKDNGNVDFFISNTHEVSYKFEVIFPVLKNYDASTTLPYKGKVEGGVEKKYLFTITPRPNASQEFSYKCSYESSSVSIETTVDDYPGFKDCIKLEKAGNCITLYEAGTDGTDTTMFVFEWDLGDGNVIRGDKVYHCYSGTGEYELKLSVFDKFSGKKLMNVASRKIIIENTGGLVFDAPAVCSTGQEIEFSNVKLDNKDASLYKMYWDFGDGNKAAGIIQKHSWNAPGDYKVILGIIDERYADAARKMCVYKIVKVTSE
ncbi:MAG: PKD domain-containing protein [Bacteroidota bacterium]